MRRLAASLRSVWPARGVAAAGLVAALLGTASCAAGGEPTRPAAAATAAPATAAPATSQPTTSAPAGSVPATAGPVTVPETLRFTAKTLDGGAFDAATLAGRPVVLWFWAPWCATCASQAWTVAEVAPKYRDTVPIVGVAGLGEQRAMKSFVTEFELAGVPQLDDRAGALWRRFEVVEQSTFVIIDRDGKVIHQGFLDGEDLTRRLATLST